MEITLESLKFSKNNEIEEEDNVMKRRGLAVVLAVVMTAFIFTGCGGNAVSNNQRQAKEQTKKETTTESSKKEETPASSSKVEQPASSAVAPVSASSSQPEVSAKPEEPAQPEAPAEPAPAPAQPEPAPAPEPEPEPQKVSDDAIRPDVKEAIDSYEAFIDRYCEFMSRSDYGDLNWLSDYAKWMEEYSKSEKNFNSLQDKDLTTAEYNYYLEVLMRCNNKLTQTASSM